MALYHVRGRVAHISLMLLLLVWVGNTRAEIAVSPEMGALIKAATAKSYAVYPVDKDDGIVDHYAGKHY